MMSIDFVSLGMSWMIAATAVEQQRVLQTGNRKHFRPIRDLQLKIFRP
jgi:predicted nucleic acid-binding protein